MATGDLSCSRLWGSSSDAAYKGHIDVVKWMVEKFPWENSDDQSAWIIEALAGAVREGNWNIMKYLFKKKSLTQKPFRCLDSAVDSGDLKLVQWLHSRGVGYKIIPIGSAALNGDIKMIEWLYKNGVMEECSLDHALQLAAIKNHFDVVQCFMRTVLNPNVVS